MVGGLLSNYCWLHPVACCPSYLCPKIPVLSEKQKISCKKFPLCRCYFSICSLFAGQTKSKKEVFSWTFSAKKTPEILSSWIFDALIFLHEEMLLNYFLLRLSDNLTFGKSYNCWKLSIYSVFHDNHKNFPISSRGELCVLWLAEASGSGFYCFCPRQLVMTPLQSYYIFHYNQLLQWNPPHHPGPTGTVAPS